MAAKSSIEWTDASWTPIRARVKPDAAEIAKAKGYTSLIQIAGKMSGHVGPHCEKVSPGCEHCYSEHANSRCLPKNGTGLPFDRRSRDLVDIEIDEKILMQPLHWREPRKVFVCSQTDLFGEFVPDELIDRVFALMALSRQHTFQVLTKRASRMRDYLLSRKTSSRWWKAACPRGYAFDFQSPLDGGTYSLLPFPLPNVWLGVSCEDQQRADERIRDLLETPAAVRFVSAEPLLGSVDLTRIPCKDQPWITRNSLTGRFDNVPFETPLGARIMIAVDTKPRIDWVIVGGESGPGARPMHPDWVRQIRDDCQAAKVPFFFKQWGEWARCGPMEADDSFVGGTCFRAASGGRASGAYVIRRRDKYRSLADGEIMERVGKKKAGRLLDGRTWDEVPEFRK